MARNCYGQVVHNSHTHNPIRFPSTDDRNTFEEQFNEYHAKHDHEGDAPRFEIVKRADIRKLDHDIPNVEDVTIDGYQWHEIKKWHDRTDDHYCHYSPPTTLNNPTICIAHGELIDSGTLERHELSALFTDMPNDEFEQLKASIEERGFIDPVIRMYEGQVLDGWHRYRAGLELNLLRRLQFRAWCEDREGDPKRFVYGRNLHRRHLTPGQRAQIAVTYNERYGIGRPETKDDAETSPNGEVKSRAELAKEANVGERTIDRAVKVEEAGEAEAVISGEKTAGEVLKEQEQTQAQAELDVMWDAFTEAGLDEHIVPSAFSRAACLEHPQWGVEEIPEMQDVDNPKEWIAHLQMLQTEIKVDTSWIRELKGETEVDGVDASLLSTSEEQVKGEGTQGEFNSSDNAENPTAETEPDKEGAKITVHQGQPIAQGKDPDAVLVPDIKTLTGDELDRWAESVSMQRNEGEGDDSLRDRLIEELEARGQTAEMKRVVPEEYIATQIAEYKSVGIYPEATEEELRELAIKRLTGTWDETREEREAIEALTAAETPEQQKKDKRACRKELERLYNFHEKLDESVVSFDLHKVHYGMDEGAVRALMAEVIAENADKDHPNEVEELWDELQDRIPKWRDKYAESGYQENELVQRATVDDIIEAYHAHQEREPFAQNNGDGNANDLKEIIRLLKSQSYILARHIREAVQKRIADPQNTVHYITITYGENPIDMVFFNSDTRLAKMDEDKAGSKRAVAELPPQLVDALLRIAQDGEPTRSREGLESEEAVELQIVNE